MNETIIICAYVISGWTALCLIVDTLTVILTRDVTAIGWYASRPLCLWKFPAFTMGAFAGMFVWLIAIIVTILTAILLI